MAKYDADRKFILTSIERLEGLMEKLTSTTLLLDKRVDRVYLTAAGIASLLGTIAGGIAVLVIQVLILGGCAGPQLEAWHDLRHPCYQDDSQENPKCQAVEQLDEIENSQVSI